MLSALEGMKDFKQGLTGAKPMSMEDAIQQLQQACNSSKLCQGCMSGGKCKGGTCPGSGRGSGMGGPGIGEGNVWSVSKTNTQTQLSRLKGQLREGRVIASFYTEGGQLKNESKVEYSDMVIESKQNAKEALAGSRIPRAYQTTVKNYFENIDKIE
jgi:hypothetical protein